MTTTDAAVIAKTLIVILTVALTVLVSLAIGLTLRLATNINGVDDDYTCLNGRVVVEVDRATFGTASVIVGESVICGRDWKISGIYGPTIEDWDAPIEFNDLKPPSTRLDKSR